MTYIEDLNGYVEKHFGNENIIWEAQFEKNPLYSSFRVGYYPLDVGRWTNQLITNDDLFYQIPYRNLYK